MKSPTTARHRVVTRLWIFALLLAVPLMSACGSDESTATLDEVTLRLKWFHGSQFAGYYAAVDRGFYAEEGLSVTFQPLEARGGDQISPVVDGRATFGETSAAALLVARSQGQPVVAIAAIYQRDPMVWVTLPESGIERPEDLPGHRMRKLVGPAAAVFSAMMIKAGLDPDSVERVEAGFGFDPLLNGEIDIQGTYVTDVAVDQLKRGIVFNRILPADYGIHAYGDTLFTSAALLAENPDLALRFLRASLRGWRWAVENPSDAAALALKYDDSLDLEEEVALMHASVPLIRTGDDEIGWMRADVWEETQRMLLDHGLLAGPLDSDAVFAMRFLESLY